MSTDLKPANSRDELRAKLEASERRMAERTLADSAQDAAGAATQYAKDNPFVVLGGAIAVGLVLGAVSKPGRRAARHAASGAADAVGGAVGSAATAVKKNAGDAVRKRPTAFTALLADALVAYGMKLIDQALEKRGSEGSATQEARDARKKGDFAAD